MLAVLIVGLALNAVALPLAGRRVWFLYRVISSGQPAPDRIEGVTQRTGAALKRQLVEVLGQKKLLKWSVPGAAHFFVFWAFIILATVYLEAYGSLIKLLLHGGSFGDNEHLSWAIPLVGHWAVLGFAQDFIAMMAFFAIIVFTVIRFRQAPKDLGRKSRFFGSHLSGAWITLFMIFNVIWTLYLFRGASAGLHTFPYKHGAFVSIGLGGLLDGLPHGALVAVEGVGLLLHIGVMLVFLIFVLNSKHLHIFIAPLNVMFGRPGVALGAAKPLMNAGKPVHMDDIDDLDEDAKLGVGAAEDFSWKGILDFETCTECGRCQDQCPAWNTEKPLSPKLLIMALRDHTMAKAPYLLADPNKRDALLEGNDILTKEVERPMVGDTGDEWFYMPESGVSVIDPDVLWSCVTCGACVEQCPVDIEHVDHIIDMRRYQVLVESNFPAELNQLFKGLENKGNPWNMSPTARLDWTKGLPFDVKVVGEDVESLDEVDWLFWVGCAGAYEDRAKKTTRAVAELLDLAGVSFAVLGNGETCNGDSARRAGNEFVFQGLAMQNIETFKEKKVKKVVSTCAHCFNTLKNEYREFGIELEVVHHTQLLNRLVREKKLTPVAAQGASRTVTYHDPCYLGRHNQVYSPPRELLNVIPDVDFVEMPRNSERSFCCGAGGARMWMEETIGERINSNRTKEAVATGADQIAVGCPFCRIMLSDGLTNEQSTGNAREEVEVLDVAQMLLASIKGETPKKTVSAPSDGGATSTASKVKTADGPTAEDTKDEPEQGDATQTEDTVTKTEDVGPAAKASGGGSSLFDLDDSDEDEDEDEKPAEAEKPAAKSETTPAPAGGGSLFDIGEDDDVSGTTENKADPKAGEDTAGDSTTDDEVDRAEDNADTDVAEEKPEPAGSGKATTPAATVPEGGSLFDIEAPAEADAPAEETEAAGEDTADADTDVAEESDQEGKQDQDQDARSGDAATPGESIPESGSLFDIEAPAEETSTPSIPEKAEDAPIQNADEEDDQESGADDADADTDGDQPAEAPQARKAPTSFAESTGVYASLFDIAAPGQEISAPADPTAATAAPADPTAATAEPAAETEVRSLKDIKAKYAESQPTTAEDKPAQAHDKADQAEDAAGNEADEADSKADQAEDEADSAQSEAPASADAAADQPVDADPADAEKPAQSDDSVAPRTDAKIDEAGSLFDL